MPASADPRIIAFGRLVGRALDEAHSRGLTTRQIEEVTGLPASTLYRWKRGEIVNPQRDGVLRFCEALDIPAEQASKTLGWDGSTRVPEPVPFVDSDVRAVLHRLNDPSVSTEEKITIRATLRYLGRGGVSV